MDAVIEVEYTCLECGKVTIHHSTKNKNDVCGWCGANVEFEIKALHLFDDNNHYIKLTLTEEEYTKIWEML